MQEGRGRLMGKMGWGLRGRGIMGRREGRERRGSGEKEGRGNGREGGKEVRGEGGKGGRRGRR